MGLILFDKNKSCLILILVLIFLVGMGCTNTRNQEEEFKTSTAALSVTVNLENIITDNSSSVLTVEDQIDLSNVEIMISNSNDPNLVQQDDKDVAAEATKVSFQFDDLNLDDSYQLKVKVKDEAGHYVYQGSDQVVVSSSISNYSLDELKFFSPKNIVVTVDNLATDITKGKIELITNNIKRYQKRLNINKSDNKAVADFKEKNIAVGEYDLRLSLTVNDEEVFTTTKSEILILPNQVTKVDLAFKDDRKKLDTNVAWESAPQNPQNFRAKLLGQTRIKLDWRSEAANYTIYRSKTNNFSKADKLAVEFSESEYLDQRVTGGQVYYYWLKARAENGISSAVVGPQKVSLPKFSGIKIYYYAPQVKNPTIVVRTHNGQKITQNMGYNKKEPAYMKKTFTAPKNWYSFKIADKYLPQTKVPLVIRFAEQEAEVTLHPVKTAWYDGYEWSYKAPGEQVKESKSK